jgi:hypothetical protein
VFSSVLKSALVSGGGQRFSAGGLAEMLSARKPELKLRMAQMARINNNLEMKIASKPEADAINETRLTPAKSAKSAVSISEFGFN